MIQWVYTRSRKSKLLDNLFVAVDDGRILDCVQSFGGKAVMTAPFHQSGTDRIAEAVSHLDADIVVNIQGDQPLIDAQMIDQAVQPLLTNPDIDMSTLKTRLGSEFFADPGKVKVVVDQKGYALYFSRSLIPYPRAGSDVKVFEHIGLYVYRKNFLMKISKIPQSEMEKMESLEQLRVLENGYRIFVVETECVHAAGACVDTPQDLDRVERMIKNQAITL
jgi:3-deoxy-manno-octulosonate cytidylyltransferase (CMP-KDO synthetase)